MANNPYAEQTASGLLKLPSEPKRRLKLLKKIDEAEKTLKENSGIIEGLIEKVRQTRSTRSNSDDE